jgi:hypothetical protein
LGVVVSMALNPEQVFYFIYLFLVVLIMNQSISSQDFIQYDTHSYSFFLYFYRLYIMLSHVSFLNWILGIFRSSLVVVLALSIRITCRYFNYVSVFLGTNDNYGAGAYSTFFNLYAMSDLVLIVYLIFLCSHSQTKTISYSGSSVTNILL